MCSGPEVQAENATSTAIERSTWSGISRRMEVVSRPAEVSVDDWRAQPDRESEAGFRNELAQQGRTGLMILASTGALFAVSGMVTVATSVLAGTGFLPTQYPAVVFQNQAVLLSCCVAIILTMTPSQSVGRSRLTAAVLVIVVAFLILRAPLIAERSMAPTVLAFVYILSISVMPFRPWMVLALGFTLTGLIILGYWRVGELATAAGYLPAFLAASVAGAVLSRLLYGMRTRLAQQQLAVRVHAENLEEANRRLEETRLQLVQSEKMASLGSLAAGIAHEINTPMGAIKANADLSRRALERLERALADGDTEAAGKPMRALRHSSEVTTEATKRIVDIVRSLRSFARLDEAEVAWTDVNECVRTTLPLVQHEVSAGVELRTELARLPRIRCHPNQINQVLMNLLMNGLQAVDGSGHIYVRTESTAEGITVAVEDDGVGIDPKHLPRIFDPGFTTKGVGVGTGLGLSIVYRIVESHDGRIDVDSEVGRGTEIRVHLPRAPRGIKEASSDRIEPSARDAASVERDRTPAAGSIDTQDQEDVHPEPASPDRS